MVPMYHLVAKLLCIRAGPLHSTAQRLQVRSARCCTGNPTFTRDSIDLCIVYYLLLYWQALIGAGSDVNAKDKHGRTPLYEMSSCHLNIVCIANCFYRVIDTMCVKEGVWMLQMH